MAALAERFRLTATTRVLDVGGTVDMWCYAPVLPRLTLANIYPQPEHLPAGIEWVEADARALPFGPGNFDLVFSNSVIEHVGGWPDQRRFANEVLRLQSPYWIQTPNYRFPVEPHVLGLGVQFLPHGLAVPYARFLSARGIATGFSREAIDEILGSTRLLTALELSDLFPNATIWHEKVVGLTKSLVAYRF